MLQNSVSKINRATSDAVRWGAIACVCLAATIVSAGSARAQVDTPAAREARLALRAVREAYAARPEWSQWSRQLNLPDVEYELRAGPAAEAGPLEAAAAQLRPAP